MNDTEKPIVNPQLRPQRKFMSGYSILALLSLLLWPLFGFGGLFIGGVLGLLCLGYPIFVVIGVTGEIIVRKLRLPYEYLIFDAFFTILAFGSFICAAIIFVVFAIIGY